MPFVVKCVKCGRVLYEGSPRSLVRGTQNGGWYTFLDQVKIRMDFHCPYCGSAFGPVSRIELKAAEAKAKSTKVESLGIPAKIAIKAEGALPAKERRRMK